MMNEEFDKDQRMALCGAGYKLGSFDAIITGHENARYATIKNAVTIIDLMSWRHVYNAANWHDKVLWSGNLVSADRVDADRAKLAKWIEASQGRI